MAQAIATRSSASICARSTRVLAQQWTRNHWGAYVPEGTPLSTELVGFEAPEAPAMVETKTEITTLSNGMKVASVDAPGALATVGVYIDAGSRYETTESAGASHMIQQMAFKSTAARSHLETVRFVEKLGGNVMAASTRENIVFQADTLKDYVPEFVDIIKDSITSTTFNDWEVEDQKEVIKRELKKMEENPQMLVTEFMHTAGYGKKNLGKPLLASAKMLDNITPDVLKAFSSTLFQPSKMVLGAAGVPHDQLVSLAEEAFGGLADVAVGAPEPAAYVGGEYRQVVEGDMSHFAIGFESCGWHDADLVPMCVLNTLLGGGASFSAGGPGKGMYTRLYQNVLNRYGYVQSATVFNTFYNDSGLFGIYGMTAPPYMGEMVTVLVSELQKVTSDVTQDELSRAKNQLKSNLLMNLESRGVLFEDVARQVLTYGKRIEPAELCAQIDAVTVASLSTVAKKCVATPPSLVVYGDISSVPRYDLIANQFS